jgi:RNA polymerase sigma-70 factor (ECF subfamily)
VGGEGSRCLSRPGRGSSVPGRAGRLILESSEVTRIFRECSGRAVATLARRFGDLSLAEEMVQEAFIQALEHWRESGPPPNPVGWIIVTARRAAIDRLRREATRDERHKQSMELYGPDEPEMPEGEPVIDDQLRLMFTCCHPSLAPNAQVALTLRLIAGLETREIAKAFLVPETTMQQRIVRAKNKIKDANIPYRVPDPEELPGRLRWVLAAIYFVFNEGYVASHGTELGRTDLAHEAIRLSRHTVEILPNEPEARGLLALLLLIESRRKSRTAADGSMILLADQDRSSWNQELIAEGQAIVRECLRVNRPGPYQIQAAINAVHSDAERAEDTDWSQIVQLYDLLYALTPTPVVAMIARSRSRRPGRSRRRWQRSSRWSSRAITCSMPRVRSSSRDWDGWRMRRVPMQTRFRWRRTKPRSVC